MKQQISVTHKRQQWDWAVRHARCPKDRGRVLELSMPKVVCEKCSANYVLAIRGASFLGFAKPDWTPDYKLIEDDEAASKEITVRETLQREVIVKVRCGHCGKLYDERENKCQNCGAE